MLLCSHVYFKLLTPSIHYLVKCIAIKFLLKESGVDILRFEYGDGITLNYVFNIHVNFVLQYAIVEGRDFLLIYCLQYIKHIKCKYQVTAVFFPNFGIPIYTLHNSLTTFFFIRKMASTFVLYKIKYFGLSDFSDQGEQVQ